MTSPRRTFTATVVPAGNATGVDVPADVVEALGSGTRPPVAITINDHTWRSRVASKAGRFFKHVTAIENAKSASTRVRRISKLIATLSS